MLFGDGVEERSGVGGGFTYDNRGIVLDDACFLKCYLDDGVSQVLGVIESYVCDDREDGTDDVRAVESASHSNFNNCNITLLFLEI